MLGEQLHGIPLRHLLAHLFYMILVADLRADGRVYRPLSDVPVMSDGHLRWRVGYLEPRLLARIRRKLVVTARPFACIAGYPSAQVWVGIDDNELGGIQGTSLLCHDVPRCDVAAIPPPALLESVDVLQGNDGPALEQPLYVG